MRWKPPVAHAVWKDTLAAVGFGSVALQPGGSAGVSGSEDCLYLNLYTPGLSGRARPVVVWVHGGSMTNGSGKGMNGHAFADGDGIVTVTINYRLGALGFLYMDDVGYRQSGNLGLLDVVAALRWVHDNIAAFGGDPGRVTVMGESAGAKLLSAVMVSPVSKGLFRQAILESGAVQCIRDSGTAKRARGLLMAELGVSDPRELVNLSGEELMRAQRKVCDGIGGILFGPVYDGVTIPEDGYAYAASSLASASAKLGGSGLSSGRMKMRGAAFVGKDAGEEVFGPLFRDNAEYAHAYYRARLRTDSPYAAMVRTLTQYMYQLHSYRLAGALSGAGVPVYVYRYAFENGQELGARHGDELRYIWDAAKVRMNSMDSVQVRLANGLHGAWVNFIRSGDPNGRGLMAWPGYRVGDPRVMVFDRVESVVRLKEVYDDKQFPSAVFVIK
ncbi:carboxylesterase/lipase family protein [Puia sp. P3]|uniref:carboxylesterase/lipase family protein n=1 Tax=Puia sp. P3 TaxID=3423952 RepID=UPI003D67E328